MKRFLPFVLLVLSGQMWSFNSFAQSEEDNVIDEVIWVVGDQAILRSDVENTRLQMIQVQKQRFTGDPYCIIPEQLAIQKLYLHQAKLDSIEITDAQILPYVDYELNNYITMAGSRERLENIQGKPLNAIREELKQSLKDLETVKKMKSELVKNVKITLSDVRNFYDQIPQDSLPYIPTTVEVQIITMEPEIPLSEIDEIKRKLREYTDLVNSGQMSFANLAFMHSQDPNSAQDGGDLGFVGKGTLAPEFAAAAFDLNDPNRVSRIVETEYGYHIIQLIEKRGDRIRVRHILLKPQVADDDLNVAVQRLDTARTSIMDGKFTFEEGVYYSSDRDTKNNRGILVNGDLYSHSDRSGTSRFEMSELPQEISKAVASLNVGEISKPFVMINTKNKKVAAIVKLNSRIEGHKANLIDDFQSIRTMAEEKKRNELLNKWLTNKRRETYIRINDNYKNCDFQLDGWVQN
jgi:Parvulin-like peptidyl-prolyl isomerase